ncbi:sensor histidine kinase [Nocardia otitidiscaviarum]|uniref:sensor histidine kinase n=1 Tax=Nocardia otitidiscaviarum TaxID=1823 RepID=UPI001895AF5A|nr:histidine kinase [Nocardia otitidiscaviarum]MBF6236393.1 sensor histidine kinase [Nocardia otitidiscaviarum]
MLELISADLGRFRWVQALSAALLVLAALVFAVVLHTLQSDTGLTDRRAVGLALIQGLAVALAPRLPLPAWAASVIAVVVASLWVDAGLWVDAMINSHLLVLAVLALSVPARQAAAYWTGTVAAGALLAALLRPPRGLSELLEVSVLAALILVAGAALRALAAARRGLRDEREAVRRQAERTALLEERTRIARELHDVVAHHMSVIAIQAEAAQFRESAAAPQTFAAIRDSAVTALGEMRRILELLRSGDTGAAPQPTVTDLPRLVDSVRGTGTRVELDTDGDLTAVPAGVGLSAYRIVQEALSNAVRHAPGASVRVRVHCETDRMRIDVDNPLPAGAVGGRAGQGLTGMRERVAAYGGTLMAAPADGRFRVRAELPIREES